MRIARLVAPGLISFLLLLATTGVLFLRVPEGLPTTPFATLLLVPLLQLAMFTSGATAVGGALVGGLLGSDERIRRIGLLSALVFSVVSVLSAVATLADVLAVQWWQALQPRMLVSFLTQIDEGRYLMLQAVLGCSAALMLAKLQHSIDGTFALILLLVATTLPGLSGHSSAAVTHWIASATMMAHLVAIDVWIGGTLVLLAVPDSLALPKFERVALGAFVLLLLSGVASTATRVVSWQDLWHDPYALVLGGKVLLALVLGGLGHALRARLGDEPDAVRRRLSLQGTLMLVALGFGVTLARMANP